MKSPLMFSGSSREVQEAVPAVRKHRCEFPTLILGLCRSEPTQFRNMMFTFDLFLLQDPSRNHKSYRDLITSLRPPLIPFTPLLLKGDQNPTRTRKTDGFYWFLLVFNYSFGFFSILSLCFCDSKL